MDIICLSDDYDEGLSFTRVCVSSFWIGHCVLEWVVITLPERMSEHGVWCIFSPVFGCVSNGGIFMVFGGVW